LPDGNRQALFLHGSILFRTFLQPGEGILQGRKVEEGNLFPDRRLYKWLPRVCREFEGVFLHKLIVFLHFLPGGLEQAYQFVVVGIDGFKPLAEFEGEHIGIGQPEYNPPCSVGQGDPILESGVFKLFIVVVGVKDGMVFPAFVFIPETQVEGGNARMLYKGGVIGS